MKVTVVIVSYRVKYFLEQTLRAAQEALLGIDHEIYVVDNNECDYSLTFLKERFPSVCFIASEQNVGFARANNMAIAKATGDYTLILNPDTVITATCAHDCLDWMEAHERCGAIGVHMVDGNGVFLPESKRGFPTPWTAFCKIFGLSKLFPRSPRFARYHLRYLSEDEPHKVDILSGAFMFCRTAVLRQVKGFDEDFFMYGEDIDLSYRIVQAGYENWYLPATIIHYKGESTKKDSMRYVKVFYEAMLIFYRKHFPRYRAVAYPIVKLGVLVRQGMAMASTVARKTFKRKPATGDNATWVILSDNASDVAAALGIKAWINSIDDYEGGDVKVVIDDAKFSYDEIVEIIERCAGKGRRFAIYSARNKRAIYPKMKDQ